MSSRKDEVLQAALALLDDVGLDALTTRRLAERLQVQPGALYRHFASKRALLDALVERIATAGPAPVLSGDWAAQVRTLASSARAGMLAHRDGARLMATFVTPGPHMLAHWTRFIAVLREAGLADAAAHVAVDTVLSYVNGFTIEEQARPATRARTRKVRDGQFAAGLELIIAGIAAGVSGRAAVRGSPTETVR